MIERMNGIYPWYLELILLCIRIQIRIRIQLSVVNI